MLSGLAKVCGLTGVGGSRTTRWFQSRSCQQSTHHLMPKDREFSPSRGVTIYLKFKLCVNKESKRWWFYQHNEFVISRECRRRGEFQRSPPPPSRISSQLCRELWVFLLFSIGSVGTVDSLRQLFPAVTGLCGNAYAYLVWREISVDPALASAMIYLISTWLIKRNASWLM